MFHLNFGQNCIVRHLSFIGLYVYNTTCFPTVLYRLQYSRWIMPYTQYIPFMDISQQDKIFREITSLVATQRWTRRNINAVAIAIECQTVRTGTTCYTYTGLKTVYVLKARAVHLTKFDTVLVFL